MIGIVQIVETPGNCTARTHLGAQAIQRHSRPPLRLRLQVDDRLGHVQRRGIRGRVRSGDLGDRERDFRKPHEGIVLASGESRVLFQRDARIGNRHEHQIAFVERRHELAADASRHEQRTSKQQGGDEHGQGRDATRRSRAPAGRAGAALA